MSVFGRARAFFRPVLARYDRRVAAGPDDASPLRTLDLSVVIPARNEAATIVEQLDALAAQEWSGSWEVVVVDNGSTDATPDVVTAYGAREPRVRLVQALERAGLNYARNVGIEATHGRAFALCDADDLVAPGWVAGDG